MWDRNGGAVGTERVLAATLAVATSTAMWQAGELSEAEYVDAVLLGSGIFGGRVPVDEGLVGMMRLWMASCVGAGAIYPAAVQWPVVAVDG